MVTEPELCLLTYRYAPPHVQKAMAMAKGKQKQKLNELLNSLTQFIQKRQRENGLSFVSRTTLTPHQFDNLTTTVFRVVLANPLTTKEILQNILKEQKEIAILAPSLTKQIEATTQAILGENL